MFDFAFGLSFAEPYQHPGLMDARWF